VGRTSREQIVQSQAGAEQARANRVQRQPEQPGYLRVAQLLEFAQQQNLAIQPFQLPDRLPHQRLRLNCVVDRRFAVRWLFAQKRGPERSLAAMGAQYLEADGIEIGSKESGRLIARRRAQDGEKGLLGQFLGLGRIATRRRKNPNSGCL
jgi:hypothetical protein